MKGNVILKKQNLEWAIGLRHELHTQPRIIKLMKYGLTTFN